MEFIKWLIKFGIMGIVIVVLFVGTTTLTHPTIEIEYQVRGKAPYTVIYDAEEWCGKGGTRCEPDRIEAFIKLQNDSADASIRPAPRVINFRICAERRIGAKVCKKREVTYE